MPCDPSPALEVDFAPVREIPASRPGHPLRGGPLARARSRSTRAHGPVRAHPAGNLGYAPHRTLALWRRALTRGIIGVERARWSLPGAAGGRKVRAPQGRVLGNTQEGQPYGKCHRKHTARRSRLSAEALAKADGEGG
jgi:hypothetical protein